MSGRRTRSSDAGNNLSDEMGGSGGQVSRGDFERAKQEKNIAVKELKQLKIDHKAEVEKLLADAEKLREELNVAQQNFENKMDEAKKLFAAEKEALQIEWKDKYREVRRKNKDRKAEISDLEEKVAQLNEEKENIQTKLSESAQEIERLKTESKYYAMQRKKELIGEIRQLKDSFINDTYKKRGLSPPIRHTNYSREVQNRNRYQDTYSDSDSRVPNRRQNYQQGKPSSQRRALPYHRRY